MKVLVADKFEKSGLDGLRAAGCEVSYEPELKDAALVQAITTSNADVLVVRSTKVTAPMLDTGRLSLIVRAGAGYNTIDIAAASSRGIYVSNCPGRNAIAVAELAFGLILSMDRRIPDNVAELRAGRWNKQEYASARGLHGRTLGILGIGHIAREMIDRAAAFGMDVVLWSRRFSGQDRPLSSAEGIDLGLDRAQSRIRVGLAATPAEAAAACDVLSVHLALTPDTTGLVGPEVLGRMRPGAFLVNTSRAEIVDHDALAEAVQRKQLRVALDVFPAEPTAGTGPFTDALIGMPCVYGTHHIGASTEQAQEAIAAETVRIVTCYKDTGKVPNVVNLATRSPATHLLVVRHRDRPGVLAHVFQQVRDARLNVQETENIVFAGAEAAVARIALDGSPSPDLCSRIASGNRDILDVQLIRF